MARTPPSVQPPTFDAATEAELAAAAEITPEDIARAQQAWRRDARPAFRDLLDAPTEPES
jgi:hypothetical protein